MLNEGSRAK